MRLLLFSIPLLFFCLIPVFCRRHTLILNNDVRVGVLCSQFVYGVHGSLSVELTNLDPEKLGKIGFSLEKSTSNALTLPSRQRFHGCPLNDVPYNRIFSLRLGKKTAKLEGTTNPALLFLTGNELKQTSLVFLDERDEKTLKSFKTHIATFFTTYSDFTNVAVAVMSRQIVNVINSDQNLRDRVIELVKQGVGSEPAVYETLKQVLSFEVIKDGMENRDANVELQRSRRKVPSLSDSVKQAENEAQNGHIEVDESMGNAQKNDAIEKQDANLIAAQDKTPESAKALKEDNPVPKEAAINISAKVYPNANSTAERSHSSKNAENALPQADDKAGRNSPVEKGSAESPRSPPTFRLPVETRNAIIAAISTYASAKPNRKFPYILAEGKVFFNFTVMFTDSSISGAYDLIFYNCRKSPIDVTISMVERNVDNYLSLGEQPLAMLFFIFAGIYALLAVVWSFYLRFSKAPVFRLHHLMLAMIIVKSTSLLFHAINHYVIGRHGVREEGWAVMYYITHMTRGLLLFVTIIMIGVGWTLIKHIFTRREKHVFLLVIPLQVVANIATIVINETEQGATRFALWKDIFLVVDLLCCAGVLFPVIWSIRHLRQAAQTDGKVAQNLRKLRLFRHFYILIICYIYFTRIIVYLLQMTAPFAWSWLVELFEHVVTLIFYVSVGYKFRPFNDNPYLLLTTSEEQDTENEVMQRFNVEEAWLQSGIAEGVTRIHRPQGLAAARENRRRRDDTSNQPFAGDAVAGDSDLLPLIRP